MREDFSVYTFTDKKVDINVRLDPPFNYNKYKVWFRNPPNGIQRLLWVAGCLIEGDYVIISGYDEYVKILGFVKRFAKKREMIVNYNTCNFSRHVVNEVDEDWFLEMVRCYY